MARGVLKIIQTYTKHLFSKIFLKCSFIFLKRERERQCEWGGAERERETQNLRQAPDSELSAQSLMRGLNPLTAKS